MKAERTALTPRTPSDLHRLPPQNLEAEQCVLGSILLQNGALIKILELLEPEDYYLKCVGEQSAKPLIGAYGTEGSEYCGALSANK